MNVHVRPPRKPTAVEEALAVAFEAQVDNLPGTDAVAETRRSAMAAFERDGLPTRRVETWHYTDLRTALRELGGNAASDGADNAPLVANAATCSLANVGATANLPDGLAVEAMRDRWAAGTVFSAPRRAYDTIGQLNGAFADGGAVIRIEPEASVERPFELQASPSAGASHFRNLIEVGSNAKATLIERHADGEDSLASTVTDVTVGEGAELLYVVAQERDDAGKHLAQLNFGLGAGAKLTLLMLQMGAKVARHEINVDVLGEGADFQLRGVNLLGGDRLTDVTMVVSHLVPNTTSEEVLRNVGTGSGRGVFQGQIRVAQVAQKTDAKMSCNTLLLSDEAEFAAKPELEIFADDVACGHGATVDDLDPNHQFYLMSRGIPEKAANALLIKGFVDEMLEVVEDEDLAEALEASIDRWLERNT